MIITRLVGGLGNQMFQYAIGRSLAIKNQTDLKLDLSEYNVYKLHDYGLDNFKIRAGVAKREEIDRLKTQRLRLKMGWLKKSHLKESALNKFSAKVFGYKGDAYLDGYWQTEKYFKDIRRVILDEFTVLHEAEGVNKDMAEKIMGCEAVSLHIRRGDYVSNPEALKVHGLCSLEYYDEAIRKIAEVADQPTFFVFSDDIDWASANLKIDYPVVFVGHNDSGKNYEDLRLMSKCRHNIIANSSFSWWGAWLNENKDKRVIAPMKWFNDQSRDSSEIVPDEWLKL